MNDELGAEVLPATAGSNDVTPFQSDEPGGAGRSPRARYRRLAVRALPYLFVAAMMGYLVTRRDDLEQLGDASIADLGLIAALVVVGAVMNASEFWLMYRAAGVPIGFRENLALFNAGQLGNYLPMQVGTMYRFRYLKSVHRLRYANTASFLVMNLALTLGSTAICGLIGLALVAGRPDVRPSWLLFAGFGLLLVLAVASAVVPLPSRVREAGAAAGPDAPRRGVRARLVAGLAEFHRGWEAVRRRPRVAAVVLLIDTLKLVVLAFRFAIAFELLGVDAPIGVFFVIAPTTALVSAVAPTPGSLGLREGAVALVVSLLGYSVPTGLLAATIDRVVMLVVAVVLGSIGYVVTGRRLREARAATAP